MASNIYTQNLKYRRMGMQKGDSRLVTIGLWVSFDCKYILNSLYNILLEYLPKTYWPKISSSTRNQIRLFRSQSIRVQFHRTLTSYICPGDGWRECCLCLSRGFSVVAPELAVPGKTTAVLVTLHGPTSVLPVNVTLRLLGDGAEELNQQLVETTQEIRGKSQYSSTKIYETFQDASSISNPRIIIISYLYYNGDSIFVFIPHWEHYLVA